MLRLQSQAEGSITIDLEQGRTSVGRDPSNDLILEDDRISGLRAAVFLAADRVEIVDLGRSDGTEVNGKAVSGRLALKPSQT